MGSFKGVLLSTLVITSVVALALSLSSSSSASEPPNQPPIADFNFFPEQPRVGEKVYFFDSSYDPDGYIVEWYWSYSLYGGDNYWTSPMPFERSEQNKQNPTLTLEFEGWYALEKIQINLRVMDDDGAVDYVSRIIQILPWGSHFSTVQIPPTDDVSVCNYAPPEPEAGEMWVRNDPPDYCDKSYYRFDLSSIPDGSTIGMAKLRASAEYDFCSGYVTSYVYCYSVDDDFWTEYTITWPGPAYNEPALDVKYIRTYNFNLYSWDVTSFVAEESADDKVVSFLLWNLPAGEWEAFEVKSKESDTPPYLEVTYEAGSQVEFSLATLYEVNLDVNLWLENNSKLVVKFYTWGDDFEGENVVWSGPAPDNVVLLEDIPHPQGKAVEKVRLDFTHDNTENVISTIASFTVCKLDLAIRFSDIPSEWLLAPPDNRIILAIEFSEIPSHWLLAPSC